jgi:hypothetical protein
MKNANGVPLISFEDCKKRGWTFQLLVHYMRSIHKAIVDGKKVSYYDFTRVQSIESTTLWKILKTKSGKQIRQLQREGTLDFGVTVPFLVEED